jgi:mannose-6-phosphate isomerase-like protein (cupin superfamily)
MLRGKVWGETSEIFNHNNISCMSLHIHKGYTCSWHKHNNKMNGFYVIKGKLLIQVNKNNDHKMIDSTLLLSKEKTYVSIGEIHRFVAITNVVALEWYWAELNINDIDRIDHGSCLDDNEFKKIKEIAKQIKKLKGINYD